MIELKNRYIKIVEEINQIAAKNNIEVNNEYKIICSEIEKFVIKIPLIGTFNAGKSSLLNKFIGENLLPVEITPETTVACEIKFGIEERIVAHSKTKEKLLPISDIRKILPTEYEYIELYKNSEELKKLNEIIFVDMPGLDSNLEYHNKAILNYIQEGVEFLVLSDIENGGLKASVLEFINEITNYNMNFSILITKIDLKELENCNSIVNNIKNSYNSEIFIGKTSAKSGDIGDFYKYINQLDSEKIFRNRFNIIIKDYIANIYNKLELKIRSSSLSQNELEKQIKDLQEKMNKSERKLDEEQKKLEYKMMTVTKNTILKDVEEELLDNIEVLVAASKISKENFSRKINSITRNIIIESFNKNIAKNLKEFIEDLRLEIDDINTEINNEDVLLKASSFIEKFFENPKIRALLIGGALFTNIVAPIIEVIIIFLPEILKILGIMNNESKIREQIENVVIPSVLDKISYNINEGILEIKNKFIEELKTKFEEEKIGYIDLLKNIEEERNKGEQEYNKKLESMREELLKLEEIGNML